MLIWRKNNPAKARKYKTSPKGIKKQSQWRMAHPDYYTKWRAKNKERRRRDQLNWARDNPDKIKIINAKYGATHKKERRKIDALYYGKYPEKRRAKNARHRARKRAATGNGVTAKDVGLQLKNQKHRCWWCNAKIKDNDYHIDHRFYQ